MAPRTRTLHVLAVFVGLLLEAHGTINVFVVPHSLCTYSTDQSSNATAAKVNDVLGNVTAALSKDSARRFTWAETLFLKRWWHDLGYDQQTLFKELVRSKHIEFASGGLVENGVATNFYSPVVSQMSLGHRWIKSTFGSDAIPRIGWQIDSAGASALIGMLWSLFGFEANVVNRIGETLKRPLPGVPESGSFRYDAKFEFIWRVLGSFGVTIDMFTHVLDSGYDSPEGFDFEGPPQENPPISSDNIKERADLLVSIIKTRSSWYRHNNLLLPFGGAFRFNDAEAEFRNMDKLIRYINSHGYDVAMRYATASEYFDAVYNRTHDSVDYPRIDQTTDFFPYNIWGYLNDTCSSMIPPSRASRSPDNDAYEYCLSYWSGQYSARANLKALSRQVDSNLRMADFFLTVAQAKRSRHGHDLLEPNTSWGLLYDAVNSAKEVQAVLQHTSVDSSSNVVVDTELKPMATQVLNSTSEVIIQTAEYLLTNSSKARPALSIDPTVFSRAAGVNSTLPITFANSLGWTQEFYARIPLKAITDDHASVCVLDYLNQTVPSQVVDTSAGWELFFLAESPPVGLSTYYVLLNSTDPLCPRTAEVSEAMDVVGTTFEFQNDLLTLFFVQGTNLVYNLEAVRNGRIGRGLQLHQRFMEYSSFEPSRIGQYDNARAFRPVGSASALNITGQPIARKNVGSLVSIFEQQLSPSVRQTIRLYNGLQTHAEVSSRIEVEITSTSKANRDLIVRFDTNISTEAMFYTDNGLQVRRRELTITRIDEDNTLNISSNYFPAQTTAYLCELDNQFMALTRQPLGVTSLEDGALELMLNRGNIGPNETDGDSSSTHTFWLLYDAPDTCQRLRQPLSYQLVYPPLVLFNNYTAGPHVPWLPVFSAVSTSLPKNVHLLSLSLLERGTSRMVGLRLNHIYEAGDDIFLSQPVTLSMTALLGQYSLSHIEETNLAITIPFDHISRRAYRSNSTATSNAHRFFDSGMAEELHGRVLSYGDRDHIDHPGQFVVTLFPLEIRSFSVSMELNDNDDHHSWFEVSSFFLGIGAGLLFALLGAFLFYVVFGKRLSRRGEFSGLDSSDESSDYAGVSPVLSEDEGEWF